MALEYSSGRSKYKGLTKKQYKRQYGSETPGSEKRENCKATGLDKAMAKYPRSHKTETTLYLEHLRRKWIGRAKNPTESLFLNQ